MDKRIFEKGNAVVVVYREGRRLSANLRVYDGVDVKEFLTIYDVHCALDMLKEAFAYMRKDSTWKVFKAIDESVV